MRRWAIVIVVHLVNSCYMPFGQNATREKEKSDCFVD